MSINRVTALAASFVWRVLKTRCPVMAAWMAISAVSTSRTSPTRITSGSWPENGTETAGEGQPDLGFTWICAIPPSWYSTGSSIVTMFLSGELIRLRAA